MKSNVSLYIVMVCTALVNAQEIPVPSIDVINPEAIEVKETLRDTPYSSPLQKIVDETTSQNKPPQVNECTSPFLMYIEGLVAEMGFENHFTILFWGLDLFPFFYRIFINNIEDGEYFGVDGQSTAQLKKTRKKVVDLWSRAPKAGSLKTTLANTKMLGGHGNFLADTSKLVQILMFLYPGYESADYDAFASDIQSFIETLPGTYNNPILSLNAIAISNEDATESTIVYGDGLTAFFESIGSSKGPSGVLAHEIGHLLQFNLKTPIDLNGDSEVDPSETRRFELMSDAFSGYALNHKKGAGFNKSEIKDVANANYSTGDCYVDEPGHHGTPDQRKCATQWGANQAKGNILHPAKFIESFDNRLGKIVEGDRSVCK